MIRTYRIKKILCSIAIIAVASCSGTKRIGECPEISNPGNFGNRINTGYDEYAPILFEDNIYFSFDAGEDGLNREFLKVGIESGEVTSATEFLFRNFELYSTPFFFKDATGTNRALFSGRYDTEVYYNLYSTEYRNGLWSLPVLIFGDLENFEDMITPSVSADGQTVFFAASTSTKDDLDLYMSDKNMNRWNDPINVGDLINSDSDEQYPFLAADGKIYFSSNSSGNFDISYSQLTDGLFEEPKSLGYPINSGSDERSFSIYGSQIYLSSDREGGCGDQDIYQFSLCGGISITGSIQNLEGEAVTEGVVELQSEGRVLDTSSLLLASTYSFTLEPNRIYSISYRNECLQENLVSDEIYSACDPTQPVKYVQDIIVSSETAVFTFEDYNLPFFSTGYYKPMTTLNLADLKQQLEYGIFKNDKRTKYIKEPSPIYSDLAKQIDKAVADATLYMYNSIDRLANRCNQIDEQMSIDITGYADPRPIPDNSVYLGPDLKSKNLGIDIRNGAQMDNDLLSKLRAFYTAVEFQNKLKKHPDYDLVSDKIRWKIEGGGVDSSPDKDMLYQRHVALEIAVFKKP